MILTTFKHHKRDRKICNEKRLGLLFISYTKFHCDFFLLFKRKNKKDIFSYAIMYTMAS